MKNLHVSQSLESKPTVPQVNALFDSHRFVSEESKFKSNLSNFE